MLTIVFVTDGCLQLSLVVVPKFDFKKFLESIVKVRLMLLYGLILLMENSIELLI
jgi:hypothetical protein